MEQNTFKNLLIDLYERYNPSNLKEVDNIVQKYVGQELDAIYYFLVKYNYSKHPNYDPNLNSLNNIKGLLKDYNEGKNTLKSPKQPSIEEQIDKVKESTGEVNKISKSLMDEVKKLKEELYNKNEPSNIQYKLNILCDDKELNLPKEINEFSIGSRFLIKDQDGKFIALEIKDIFYDFISIEGGFIKEITIDKV